MPSAKAWTVAAVIAQEARPDVTVIVTSPVPEVPEYEMTELPPGTRLVDVAVAVITCGAKDTVKITAVEPEAYLGVDALVAVTWHCPADA